jgi:hypothetical protein
VQHLVGWRSEMGQGECTPIQTDLLLATALSLTIPNPLLEMNVLDVLALIFFKILYKIRGLIHR